MGDQEKRLKKEGKVVSHPAGGQASGEVSSSLLYSILSATFGFRRGN